ncbi:hypothetical protein EIK77_000786 [Talaromyces pinophilus]|uniref:Uncharacterized protein n=1 Tax=Talaromyces pinophilus TaxID=128442 RepID=A0A0B8N339_TALPI|nr:hypothetical protein EIK77_000786 [Talaromyces pinophilus]PCH07555.1 hypothetical protein PENOC_018530 [Penicillium occitanis (nom. inval.)]PCH08822.1 Hypothetical protein PENO1_005040 [Penicillium occitanis (nom. inval.)]GAM37253.1 hypothetical protein TCE0_023r07025 [Talaromyces pinophilus]
MIFSVVSSLALLATSVVALPSGFVARQSPNEITFTIINDQTGAQAAATVPIDGSVAAFQDLFGTSSLASNGRILATSSQLIAFPQGVDCIIYQTTIDVIGHLTPEHTYLDLDGNPNAAIPVDVSGDHITCSF